MVNFYLMEGCCPALPVPWTRTLQAVFRIKQGGMENYVASRPKTIALAIIGFGVAILALIVLAFALGTLFSIPLLTSLATAAISAIFMGGALSQGALIAAASGGAVFFLGGLIVGSLSVDLLRRGTRVVAFRMNDENYSDA